MLKKERLALMRSYYPNAMTTIDTVNRVIDLVEDKLELDPAKVMIADSICGDDVNSIQYPIRSKEFLGPFKMGGLNGFPFAGLTAMQAVASHVPSDGAVYIYYGPHIGISKDGTIGSIRRIGIEERSPCCGAINKAIEKLKNDKIYPNNLSEIDYQMNVIEQILFYEKYRILKAEKPIQEATAVLYEAIDKRINELIDTTTFHCKYILLMGTILINSDEGMGSFSSAKRFEVIDIQNKSREDLLSLFV